MREAEVFHLADSPGKRALKGAGLVMTFALASGAFAYAVIQHEPPPVAVLLAATGALISIASVLVMTRPPTLTLDAPAVRELVVKARIFKDSESGEVPVVVLRFPTGKPMSIGSWGATTTDWPASEESFFAPRYQLDPNRFYALTEMLGIYSRRR